MLPDLEGIEILNRIVISKFQFSIGEQPFIFLFFFYREILEIENY